MEKIKTPIGEIEAKIFVDPDYPGIWIRVNGEDLVLVEYDQVKKKHVIRVWDDKNPDDECEYMKILG